LAERLVVDLKDKLEDMAAAPHLIETGPSTEDVLSALVNLGYQRPLAQKAIAAAVAKDKTVAQSFEALFRAALAGMRN
jgi:Holliday junction DNA helicase RuvA